MSKVKADYAVLEGTRGRLASVATDMRETLARMFTAVDEINGNVWSGVSQVAYITNAEAAEVKAYDMPNTIDSMCETIDGIVANYKEVDEMLSNTMKGLTTDVF